MSPQARFGGAGDEIAVQVMGASVQVKTIAVIGDVDVGAVDGKGFIEVQGCITLQGGLNGGDGVLNLGAVDRAFGGDPR